jgi:hypothetical protein
VDAMDKVDVASICELSDDAVSVNTVSVDVTASVLVEMVDPVSVEYVRNRELIVDPVIVDP